MIYDALVEGARSGLAGEALSNFVVKRVPKANSKRIVRASLLALRDPTLPNRNISNVIYALGIKHRLADIFDADDIDDFEILAPTIATASAKPSAEMTPLPTPASPRKRGKKS
jgi:hypothetical protein